MKRSRFSDEQIIGILKEHQAGMTASELCRKHGISDATFYTWRKKYGGMEVSEAAAPAQLRPAAAPGWVRPSAGAAAFISGRAGWNECPPNEPPPTSSRWARTMPR
ncbi:hypothetical protein RHIZ404_70016 [Rhizobium sp. EC-SD404]|nr:hypothetical protein RHIZ404_70016 [Rhizobium sp. EC-SD404]